MRIGVLLYFLPSFWGLPVCAFMPDGQANSLSLNNLETSGSAADQSSLQTELTRIQDQLASLREKGDRASEAQMLIELGVFYKKLRRFGAAVEAFQASTAISMENDDFEMYRLGHGELTKLEFTRGEYQAALGYEREMLSLAVAEKNREEEAQSLNDIGVLHRKLGHQSTALKYYHQSLALRREIGDSKGEAQSLNNLGIIHKNLGNYHQALAFQLASLKIKKTIGSPPALARSYSNLGILYRHMGDLEKALEHHNKALVISEKSENLKGLASSHHNMAAIFSEMGDLETSLFHLQRALAFHESLGDQSGMAKSLTLMGAAHSQNGASQKAVGFLQRALNIGRKTGNRYDLAFTYLELAKVRLEMRQWPQARQVLDAAMKLLNASEYKHLKRTAHQLKSRYFAAIGEYKNALDHQNRELQLVETLSDIDNRKKIADLQVRFEVDTKEKEIALLRQEGQIRQLEINRQKILRNATLGGLGFAFFLGFLLMNRYRLSMRANALLQVKNRKIHQQNYRLGEVNSELKQKTMELEKVNEELYRASVTDRLTRVYNRSYLMDYLRREMRKAIRHKTPLAVLMIDFDFFKAVNDNHGHIMGDKILKEAAWLIHDTLRVEDLLARYGGEEFLVVLPNTNCWQARVVAEKVRKVIDLKDFVNGEVMLKVTVSLGIADLEHAQANTINDFINCADAALYEAKKAGRNRFAVYRGAASPAPEP